MSDIVMTPDHLRKAAKCVHITVEHDDIAAMLSWAADEIERLRADRARLVLMTETQRASNQEIERLRDELKKAHRLLSQSVGWQRDAEIAKAKQEAEIERLRAALDAIMKTPRDAWEFEDGKVCGTAYLIARRALEEK